MAGVSPRVAVQRLGETKPVANSSFRQNVPRVRRVNLEFASQLLNHYANILKVASYITLPDSLSQALVCDRGIDARQQMRKY